MTWFDLILYITLIIACVALMGFIVWITFYVTDLRWESERRADDLETTVLQALQDFRTEQFIPLPEPEIPEFIDDRPVMQPATDETILEWTLSPIDAEPIPEPIVPVCLKFEWFFDNKVCVLWQ